MTFKQLIVDIISLENEGINIMVDNKNQLVYFSLALIIGDNLGLHSILGFTESFMANYPCRFCKCSKIECNFQIMQNNNQLRNEDNYKSDILMNNISVTGIKEISIWNQIPSFHVTRSYSVDIMHDVLEGVCNYDLAPLLNYFILKFKYFSLDTLNNRIQCFNYGPIENQNRPPLLSVDFLKTNQIKMSATEMLCFTRHLGLMIGDLVPTNSEIWEIYLILKQIIDIITAKNITKEYPILLSTLITEHHDLYLKLFKTNLKPKHHHY